MANESKLEAFLKKLQSGTAQYDAKEDAMHVYAYERTMAENGVLTLENLPFHAGEKGYCIIPAA